MDTREEPVNWDPSRTNKLEWLWNGLAQEAAWALLISPEFEIPTAHKRVSVVKERDSASRSEIIIAQ